MANLANFEHFQFLKFRKYILKTLTNTTDKKFEIILEDKKETTYFSNIHPSFPKELLDFEEAKAREMSSSKLSDGDSNSDPRFEFIRRAVTGLSTSNVDSQEISNLASVEEVRSFLDDASCRVLRISTNSSSRLIASNKLEGSSDSTSTAVAGAAAVSFVKVGVRPLEPDNMNSEVMVTSHGKNQTPLRNLYSAVHNLYAPTLLDNDRWSAQLGDKLQELLAKLDTSLSAVVNNENDDGHNGSGRGSRDGRGNDNDLYGSPTTIHSLSEEFEFWSDQISTGSGRIRSAATRFRDALEPISTRWSSMEDTSTKMKLSELIDLLEDTQNCFDDVWKVDGLSGDQKYPQSRMEHMFGVVASKIGRHIQRALSKLDLFHGPFTSVSLKKKKKKK